MTNMKPPQEGRNTGAPSLRGLQGRSATGLNGQAAKEEVSALWRGGWMPENISGVPAGRSVFHLTSPLIGRYENHLQKCGEYGQQPRGSVPRFLPRLAHQRHAASNGSPHLGAKDCGDHSHRLEERSTFRRETTEATSSLSVSDQESVPSLGDHPWRWQSGFF